MKLRYLNRTADANNSSGGPKPGGDQGKPGDASQQLLNDAEKGKTSQQAPENQPGGDQGKPGDGQKAGPGTDIKQQGNESDEQLERDDKQRRADFDERQEREKEEFIDKLAGKVANHIAANNGTGILPPKKTSTVAPVLSHEQKVIKYGPGYVSVKNKDGAKTIFTAVAWKNLGKNKLGWVPFVETPPEVEELNK
jgi:hypothetical protein